MVTFLEENIEKYVRDFGGGWETFLRRHTEKLIKKSQVGLKNILVKRYH